MGAKVATPVSQRVTNGAVNVAHGTPVARAKKKPESHTPLGFWSGMQFRYACTLYLRAS